MINMCWTYDFRIVVSSGYGGNFIDFLVINFDNVGWFVIMVGM